MASSRTEYAGTLAGLEPDRVPAFLSAHSNLPGPRANLTLLDAAADVLPRELARQLAGSDEEFLACCGVATLGRLILEEPDPQVLRAELTGHCADARWRVREACAIAAQRIGDADPGLLREIVSDWVSAADPLVVRAGIAAICEPRLLADPVTAEAALAACGRATSHLRDTAPGRRRHPDVRTLRQALGYCWSVAVAGSPRTGLVAFAALPTGDPDIAWVARENRRKQRLARLIG